MLAQSVFYQSAFFQFLNGVIQTVRQERNPQLFLICRLK